MTDAIIGQVAREILRDGQGRVRVAQIAREVLHSRVGPGLQVAQLDRQVLVDGDAKVKVAQLDRQVLVDGDGKVKVAQLARLVLRSRRDSPYPNFPVRLFSPPSLSLRIEGGAVLGGLAVSGDSAIEALNRGGRWEMDFSETKLWTRAKVLAWRTFSAAADMGVMPVIVPLWDRLHQPFADPAYHGSTSFGRVVWRDTIAWEAAEVQAVTTADAQALATEISFSFAGGELVGGEHFSIYGPRYGWRLYRLVRIEADIDGVKTAVIRPPLREWAGTGTPLDFDTPRCTMRVDGDIDAIVERLRFGKGTARFVETFDRYP